MALPKDNKIKILNTARKESLFFHIKSDDYFGTLATVLDLMRQDILKQGFLKTQAKTLNRIKKDLLLLQKDFRIIKK